MAGIKSSALQLQKLIADYGVAWIIVNQTLGWITYFMIYAFLVFSGVDVLEILGRYQYTRELTKIGSTAGNLTIAFALNRLGTPVRVVLTTYLMKYTAGPINAAVNPLLERFGMPTLRPVLEDFPGVENDLDDAAENKKKD